MQEKVCDKITEDFEATFALDYTADYQPPDNLLPLAVSWALDNERAEIVINLAPLVIKAEAKRSDPLANM